MKIINFIPTIFINRKNQADGIEKMIKIGVLSEPENKPTPIKQGRFYTASPNMMNFDSPGEVSIHPKYMSSTESHKEDHSMLRMLNEVGGVNTDKYNPPSDGSLFSKMEVKKKVKKKKIKAKNKGKTKKGKKTKGKVKGKG